MTVTEVAAKSATKTTRKAPAKAPAKRAPTRKAPVERDEQAERTARVAEAADQRTNAMALTDALSQARLSREELTRRVVARGGLAGQVWRESIKGTVDDADRAFIWGTLVDYCTEDAERAARVADHVREVAAPYLERSAS